MIARKGLGILPVEKTLPPHLLVALWQVWLLLVLSTRECDDS